jgi:hypothetical protein
MLRKKEQKEMDSQLNHNITSQKSDPRSDNESTDVFSYIPRLELAKANKSLNTDDELIAFLQNHRENRRARQVFEWEARRRQTLNYL